MVLANASTSTLAWLNITSPTGVRYAFTRRPGEPVDKSSQIAKAAGPLRVADIAGTLPRLYSHLHIHEDYFCHRGRDPDLVHRVPKTVADKDVAGVGLFLIDALPYLVDREGMAHAGGKIDDRAGLGSAKEIVDVRDHAQAYAQEGFDCLSLYRFPGLPAFGTDMSAGRWLLHTASCYFADGTTGFRWTDAAFYHGSPLLFELSRSSPLIRLEHSTDTVFAGNIVTC